MDGYSKVATPFVHNNSGPHEPSMDSPRLHGKKDDITSALRYEHARIECNGRGSSH